MSVLNDIGSGYYPKRDDTALLRQALALLKEQNEALREKCSYCRCHRSKT